MEQPKRTDFTADEFIAWALDQPTGSFELDNGRVVAMAPEGFDHGRAKARIWRALDDAVRARGLPCEAHPDGASVRIDDRTVYEPDALVQCGPRAPGDAIETSAPIIVVEVASPSSRGVDRGLKLVRYFSLPSVRHYLIVDIEKRVVVHHERDDGGAIGVRIASAGPLALDPPGLVIEVADVFAGLST